MNKGDFIALIAEKNDCTKGEAEKIVDIFTSSVTSALADGQEVSLVGFGAFSVRKVEERKGRNPQTNQEMTIPAYNQPKFKVGQKLKTACNA